MDINEISKMDCLDKDLQIKSEIIVQLLGLITETGDIKLRDKAFKILKATV